MKAVRACWGALCMIKGWAKALIVEQRAAPLLGRVDGQSEGSRSQKERKKEKRRKKRRKKQRGKDKGGKKRRKIASVRGIHLDFSL